MGTVQWEKCVFPLASARVAAATRSPRHPSGQHTRCSSRNAPCRLHTQSAAGSHQHVQGPCDADPEGCFLSCGAAQLHKGVLQKQQRRCRPARPPRAAGGAGDAGSFGTAGLPDERNKPVLSASGAQALVSDDRASSPADWSKITPDTLWEGLLPTIKYLPAGQLALVEDALKLAFEAHSTQKRKSGEPYIIHPVAVAEILGELEMDFETVIAGLLHDTVEDTAVVTFERIEEQFGPVVRRIVEGETKVSKLGKMQRVDASRPARDVKADDLQQMFLAMTNEVRVIIVKLADRLHNMRTLEFMSPEKQKAIAEETLQVFAPLARLLGMYKIKSELEMLSFKYSNREMYAAIVRRMDELCKQQEEVVLEARDFLADKFEKDFFLRLTRTKATVTVQCKEIYSTWRKMVEEGGTVEDIQNVAQLCIILDEQLSTTTTPEDDDDEDATVANWAQVCYHVLGVIHAMWPPVPGSVKDYIATPKPNGYQSLHTTVLPRGSKTLFPLEIQIRTREMHRLAEMGIAAHGKGPAGWGLGALLPSEGVNVAGSRCGTVGPGRGAASSPPGARLNKEDIVRRVSWLTSIREWQEEFLGQLTAREFVDTITDDLLGSRVFVFTPQGEVVNLPRGATVVDYAYHIHTDVGNAMVAAKINGRVVSPSHTLCNAEVVEVVTYDRGENQSMSTKQYELHRSWLRHARTRSARYKLTKFLKECALECRQALTEEALESFASRGFSEADAYLPEEIGGADGGLELLREGLPDDGGTPGEVRDAAGGAQVLGDADARAMGASMAGTGTVDTAGERVGDKAIDGDSSAVPGSTKLPAVSAGEGSPSAPSKRGLNGTPVAPNNGSGKGRPVGSNGARLSPGIEKLYANGEPLRILSAPEDMSLQSVAFQGWLAKTLKEREIVKAGQCVFWLAVECEDRAGLLADVSSILSQTGLSINSYVGASELGVGFMVFEIDCKANIEVSGHGLGGK
eukprot:jgi/Mesvir1/27034/Mv20734-RA.2